MKKRTIWTKLGDFLEGRGFYIVLALCIVAIGGSGYYLYRMISLSDQLSNQTVSAQASVPSGAAQEKTDTEQAVEDAVKAAADRAAAAKAKAEEKTKTAAAKTQEKDPTKSAQGDQDLTAKPSQDAKANQTKPAAGTPAASWSWPVTGKVLATFSTNKLSYNRALEDWRAHTGMDISAQVGDIVASACDGTVIAVQENVMLGQTVTIQTADKLKVTYGNLAAQVPVKAGDTVKAGQTIGNVGKTAAGEAHDKAWIHLAVEKDGKAVDPKPYLKTKK